MVDSSAEIGLRVGNTCFKQTNLHNYIRVTRGRSGMGVTSVIDLMVK